MYSDKCVIVTYSHTVIIVDIRIIGHMDVTVDHNANSIPDS